MSISYLSILKQQHEHRLPRDCLVAWDSISMRCCTPNLTVCCQVGMMHPSTLLSQHHYIWRTWGQPSPRVCSQAAVPSTSVKCHISRVTPYMQNHGTSQGESMIFEVPFNSIHSVILWKGPTRDLHVYLLAPHRITQKQNPRTAQIGAQKRAALPGSSAKVRKEQPTPWYAHLNAKPPEVQFPLLQLQTYTPMVTASCWTKDCHRAQIPFLRIKQHIKAHPPRKAVGVCAPENAKEQLYNIKRLLEGPSAFGTTVTLSDI